MHPLMSMKEFDEQSLQPQLNMSSLTAYKQLILSNTSAPDIVAKIDYLRKSDPTHVHFDWPSAENWWKSFGVPSLTSDEALYKLACKSFVESNPILLNLTRHGRESLISNLEDDELQVFRNAGLLEKILDDDAIEWWDSLRLISRTDLNNSLLQQGRKAERWTIENELSEYLNLTPELTPRWVSLDSDHYGYDILSYRTQANNVPNTVLIEVKSFARISDPHFYLSSNEWKKAVQTAPNYLFYIWCIETKEHRIQTVDQVQPHIPLTTGQGIWQNVLIRMNW